MSSALTRSLPLAIALGDVRVAELGSSVEMASPPRGSNPSSSRSSIPRSGSESSLESQSPSSSPTYEGIRKHPSSARPTKSCLSARDRNGRRKNVTFAFDSAHSSSDDLQASITPETQFLTPSGSEEDLSDGSNFTQSSGPLSPRDREHKHMEAKALLQYHANSGQPDLQDSMEGLQSPITTSRSPSPTSALSSHLMAGQSAEAQIQSTSPSQEVDQPTERAPSSPNFGSPLSGLRSIGSELDRSNCVLQSFMQRAAMPEMETKASLNQNGWILSAGFLVTAPVVFSLVMDTILG